MRSKIPALGLRQATLRLVEHDPIWADLFEIEVTLIFKALPGVAFEIDHIGSTAVPDLPAKPILDIAIRSNHETEIATALTNLGYIDRGIRSGRLFIRLRDGDVRTHNLHLYPPNDVACLDHITFRDALRADPSLRKQYAELKQNLVESLGDAGRGQYADRKTNFIKSVVQSQKK
ncbi:GrpB family protein [Roseibium sp. SCP14]|uniref:GrpB family protein n=1 Tax=Roseibium sp. SCP14 TaxID=3141375 RepID=UPI0033382BD4